MYSVALQNLMNEGRFYPCKLSKKATHQVGQRYWIGYWGKYYKVLDVDGPRITVEWQDGKVVTHMTSLDRNRDCILFPFECNFKSPDLSVSYRYAEILALMHLSILPNDISMELSNYIKNLNYPPADDVYYHIMKNWQNDEVFLKRDIEKSPKNKK